MENFNMPNEIDNLKPMSEQVAMQSLLLAIQTTQGQLRSVNESVHQVSLDVREVRDKVISIEATDKANNQSEIIKQIEIRLRASEIAIGRLTLAITIGGAIGGSAVAVVLTKIFLH